MNFRSCAWCHAATVFLVHPLPFKRGDTETPSCALHLGDVLRDQRTEDPTRTEWKVLIAA